jgi:3-dehydroquinate synthase
VCETLTVQSHRGPYTVYFDDPPAFDPGRFLDRESHFLVDAKVAGLYAPVLRGILSHPNTIVIEAREENKSIEQTIPVFERLVANRVRRDQTIVAIGGGIIQDICCFVASTLLRGLPWRFVPTTLLAQADSCIGSKSSINLGATKNILGTFNPPVDVFIHAEFLDTLEAKEIRSGIGEILKVHAIDGVESFDALASEFDELTSDRSVLQRYIRSALRVKQRFIEEDEFDRGIRNVFNYGHSFGHAIESATHYFVPHGIAVSIGMDMANFIAAGRGLVPEHHYWRMHTPLRANYDEYARTAIPLDALLSALMKDKKNTSTKLGLILPVGDTASIQRVLVPADDAFHAHCAEFLDGMLAGTLNRT